jgi:dihydrolipoamide dehydrogenase
VAQLTAGLAQLGSRRRVRYIAGRGRFRDAATLDVQEVSGATYALRFAHAVVATGSSPGRLPGLAVDGERIVDSTGALELRDVPARLLVVGGGYIGLEIGTVYAALGSRVTLVEVTDGLLPGVDRDLVRPVAARVERAFDGVLLRTRVAEARAGAEGVHVTLEGATTGDREFDRVLVAVGRRPNSEGIGLEQAGVEIGERGFVRVDERRRTAVPTIYAIGDVVGEPMLAHKASHEGRTAVEAIAGRAVAFDPQAIPAVVFTDPEIAWCGLTESRAKAEGRSVSVVRFPWPASGRAATLGRPDGVTKLLVDPDTGRVLGAGITGAGAGELIAEAVLAVEMGATAADLALSIHPHPTLSETLMEAAESVSGTATHIYRGAGARGVR